IVGGGPVGLFGAFYAGLRGMKTKIIEALPQLGGQPMAMYPEKYIFDVGGHQAVLAKDLVAELIKQATQFNPTVVLGEEVEELQREGDVWKLSTAKGVHYSKTVVITAGMGAFSPKKLPLENLEKYENGHGVEYAVVKLDDYRGKRVLVVGGGDSAVDFANMLEPVAAQVTIIHRRDRFRAHEASVEKMQQSSVVVKTPFEVKELHGEERLEAVTVFNNKTKEEETIPVDACVFALGFTPDLSKIERWGLELDNDAIVIKNFKMETNLPGVFAAGDIATYDGKIKLIATGFGEVANAVNHAVTLVDPAARYDPGHSSSRKDLQPIVG
ncbi:MAG: NAD(P)/FAD-dependent oxidoreductase, partial [Limnochordales bacterium]